MALHWTPRLGAAWQQEARESSSPSTRTLEGEELRRARLFLTLSGVVGIVAGVVAFIVPVLATVAITVFTGWVLMAVSIAMIWHAVTRRDQPGMALRLLTAVLTFAIGLWLVAFPLPGAFTLTTLLAAWFFATGVLMLGHSMQQRDATSAGFTALNGVLSLVLGLLLIVNLPSSAAWAVGLLVGVNLVFWGVRSLMAARRLPETADAW